MKISLAFGLIMLAVFYAGLSLVIQNLFPDLDRTTVIAGIIGVVLAYTAQFGSEASKPHQILRLHRKGKVNPAITLNPQSSKSL